MKKIRMYSICAAIVGLMFFGSAVFGDDFYPAPWPRDLSIAMTAEWEFQTDPGVWGALEPDGIGGLTNLSAGGGMATVALHDEAGVGQVGDGDGEWYFANGGVFAIQMDNVIDLEPLKHIWVQTTYSGPDGLVPTIVYSEPDATLVDAFDIDVNHRVEYWQMRPNPDYELLAWWVPAGVAIDQVIVDTISIPEPMTIFLLGFGSLVLMRRRRS